MPVLFNGSGLIPSPLVDISRNYIKDAGNFIVAVESTFTLTGTIVNTDGILDSPGASGVPTMEGVLAGETYIRRIFGIQNGLLQIQSPAQTTTGIQTYATVESLNFNRGTWVNRADYTVVLKSRHIEGSSDANYLFYSLRDAGDSWTVSENEDGTYLINHQIQAVGIYTYTSGIANNPFTDAKQWVLAHSYSLTTNGVLVEGNVGSGDMRLDNLISVSLPATTGYWNRSTVESANPWTYTYGLTETFIYNPSGTFREEYNVNINYEVNTNRANVSLNGTVFGYADRANNYALKFTNAKAQYDSITSANFLSRANTYLPGGYNLIGNTISKQITYEPYIGDIKYSYNYLAVSGSPMVSGAIDENINISDNGATDIFALIPIPGRANGPVFQNMSTRSPFERTISISATMGGAGPTSISNLLSAYTSKPNTDAIINALIPSSGSYYLKQNSEEWNPIKRAYSRSTSWVIDVPSGVTPIGMPSVIHNIV